MTLYKWSQTAENNATADSSINWQEGQAPSSVNDSGRAMMASIAKHRDDIAGAIVTGGTATAYTVTSYEAFDTLVRLNGQIIAFTPHATNGGTVTLNVDSLGPKPLRSAPATELMAGTLIQGTPYLALYNHSDAAFYLHGFYGNPYNVPLAAGMDFWGVTAPNSAFAFPAGQELDRTTYASLFAIVGTTYGSGNGSTTFNLPDKRGRVSAADDDMGGSSALRLTSAVAGFAGDTLGAAGGSQSQTLVTANLPAYTPAGSVSVTVTSTSANVQNNIGGTASANLAGGATDYAQKNSSIITSTGTGTFTGTAQGGTSMPVRTVQPTIICNYIMRII
ncbi:phage tail protein [Bradyrhizobium lablabi]|uniref:Phage tail protein n=1 Tax=Bradyrhizobium lablabi TaxID=722472 RepID=A0A0R3NDK0_9BRAD|nr:tail fiber protein [Bradyrhizobium lablabi]KRR27955.1 phage tail protein [Bradyrhizobium lablabi]